MARAKVFKSGNSQAVRLPNPLHTGQAPVSLLKENAVDKGQIPSGFDLAKRLNINRYKS